MKKNIYMIIFSVGLLACTKPLQQEIRKSISANQTARSLFEWESAAANPRAGLINTST